MNVQQMAGQAFPLVSTGDGFYEIRKSQSSTNVLFGLHCIDPEDPFVQGLSGTYIREEIGVADALLPDGYREMCFESPEAAYDFCMAELSSSLSASLKVAA